VKASVKFGLELERKIGIAGIGNVLKKVFKNNRNTLLVVVVEYYKFQNSKDSKLKKGQSWLSAYVLCLGVLDFAPRVPSLPSQKMCSANPLSF